jgi:succinyl-diaminopimelate desuccinylase
MMKVVSALSEWKAPPETDRDFWFGPKLSVTSIAGGEGFSQIPDRCTSNVDLRLTPNFNAAAGRKVIEKMIRDANCGGEPEWLESWPAYRLEDDHPLVKALRDAARKNFGREVPTAVSGASNIGNYLSTLHVPAVCGFGVSYQNLHATDECIDLETIEPTYSAYRDAVLSYLSDTNHSAAQSSTGP